MRLLRLAMWLVALVPIAAAGYWASFAARMPEPLGDRRAMLEVTPRWSFGEWFDASGEPLHAFARAVHLALLQVPDATIASVAWVQVLLALLIVVALCDLVRRTFPARRGGAPLAFLVLGLLVASPAFGANWLHGQRLGVLAVVALLAFGLKWLQGEGRFAGRALLALLIAGAAPWFHLHGSLVAVALLPSLLTISRDAGGRGRWIWALLLLAVGGAATWFTLRTAPGIRVAGADWLAAWTSAPGATLHELLHWTGAAWLDAWPDSTLDEQVLGGVSLLLPVALLFVGDRSPSARVAAAPWWGCFAFGLLLVLLAGFRHEFAPPVGTAREAMYGTFLLPVGLIGVLAARTGPALLPIAAGALIVLGLQDWGRGREDLRLAIVRAEAVEAALVVPESMVDGDRVLPVRDAATLAMLQQRGWVPATNVMFASDAADGFAATADSLAGGVHGGSPSRVWGSVRSRLDLTVPLHVVVVAKAAGQPPRVVGDLRPTFAGSGRSVTWQLQLSKPLADGDRVRAMGLLVRQHRFAPIGAVHVVRDGELVPVTQ